MKTVFHQRRRALVARLRESQLDRLLITSPANWYYLTGFTGEAGALVLSREETALITDGRFTVQGREETSGIAIVLQKGSLFESVGQFLKKSAGKRIGFDPAHLSVAHLQSLRKAGGKGLRYTPITGAVEALRMRKDAAELAQMRRAAILAGDVFSAVLPLLKPGVREFEVGAEIEYQMRRQIVNLNGSVWVNGDRLENEPDLRVEAENVSDFGASSRGGRVNTNAHNFPVVGRGERASGRKKNAD